MSETVYPAARPVASVHEFAAAQFQIQQLLQRLQTMTLVKVLAVTNSGGITPSGTVDVQPLLTLLSGNRTATAHAPLYKLPYFRLQGGVNAIILDPEVGDIGMAGFCSRDISAVKKTKGLANPGSLRQYDFADGLYFGGMLNGVPTQYIAFAQGGITVQTPNALNITATQGITLNGVTIDQNGNVATSGAVTSQGTVLHTHVHTDPQGGDTGPPV